MTVRRLMFHLMVVAAVAGSGCTSSRNTALVDPSPASPATRPATHTAFPSLPQKASSFGVVAADGWLYVYGGHIADTHNYSTATVSGDFHRLNLTDPLRWETLPGGPHLQGLNLATWHGLVFRVGGMSPANRTGDEAKVISVADVARYDPATRQWSALPKLPEPRSSHDVAVIGNTLFVTGGWTLTGDAEDAAFHTTTLTLDLSAKNPQWSAIAQPFKRRALIAAVHDGKLYVIGGFDEAGDPSRSVDVFDPKTQTWSRGPGLPGPDENGFGPAACVAGSTLYVSVADGSLYTLNDAFNSWDRVGSATPRIVHRMVANGSKVLILGGARGPHQTDLIEAIDVSDSATTTTPQPAGGK